MRATGSLSARDSPRTGLHPIRRSSAHTADCCQSLAPRELSAECGHARASLRVSVLRRAGAPPGAAPLLLRELLVSVLLATRRFTCAAVYGAVPAPARHASRALLWPQRRWVVPRAMDARAPRARKAAHRLITLPACHRPRSLSVVACVACTQAGEPLPRLARLLSIGRQEADGQGQRMRAGPRVYPA